MLAFVAAQRHGTFAIIDRGQTLRRFRARITALLAELESQSEATLADRAPVELDQQSVGRLSRMDAMQLQAMAAASETRRRTERARLRRALRRIEDATFGDCADCGETIADGRLEADPAAHLCIACAQRARR